MENNEELKNMMDEQIASWDSKTRKNIVKLALKIINDRYTLDLNEASFE